MQYIKYAGIAIALFMSGSVIAQQTEAKADTAKPAPSAPASAEIKVPSDEEIKGFVTEYKESATSTTTTTFRAKFAVPRLTPEQKKKYADAKTAPFQITMDLIKYQTVEKQTRYAGRVTEGTGSFVILDEQGKVVKSMSDNLIKLCSS
jgi:hypothetical protein